MPAALLHFSSLRRSQHNYVRAMPALKFQQNLRQKPSTCRSAGAKGISLLSKIDNYVARYVIINIRLHMKKAINEVRILI